ncbi:unnamed protein product [Haemonchus placei]|uniref:DOMON domain-containing protein n=1 Tax=Haemonchus placei TaxID=6290 RepID=A0A0N4X2H6_HAEPC|nr:unnamed protein product [Haemonchus placei]
MWEVTLPTRSLCSTQSRKGFGHEAPRSRAITKQIHSHTNNLSAICRLSYSLAFSFEGCNATQSCWFHPPNCNANERGKCISGVRWYMEPDGLRIQLQTHVNDLDPHRPAYAALGFSYNQRMDDDTVVECVQPLQGQPGQVRVSFNDETFNNVLHQASSVLLEGGSVTMEDGVLKCDMKLLLDNIGLVSNDSKFMIHDLEARPYYLLFARGNADPWTLEKDIHSVNDNPQFPWMTEEMVGALYAFGKNDLLTMQQ